LGREVAKNTNSDEINDEGPFCCNGSHAWKVGKGEGLGSNQLRKNAFKGATFPG